ncbi:receptor-like protein kinase ANXUR2 [Prosopis cineraria]|uniref:receptor-like protein kinase ANXUR2 n=1 Tax=Prosopis cineraria TaxID=364024 RepID=UPI00240FE87F|nr:receptor-like protein kinase ANXUR2 [Prosopis cineraria]
MATLLKCFGGSASTSRKRKQPSTTVEELCHRFSLSQLEEATNNFHPTRMIGEGAFGPVYRGGRISIDGQSIEIAVKRIPPGNSFQGRSEFENEIVMMCQLHHPNLVSLVGFCDDKNEMIVVYKYVPNNSLYYQLYEQHGKSSPVEPWKKRLEISIGVARALQYLHSGTKRTIIHRSAEPGNIILDENWNPKLTYFGLSIKGPKFSAKEAKPIKLDVVEGPWGYIAPECWALTNVTYKCDVYSFGVILLELICGKMMFQICEHEGRLIESADATLFACSVVKKVRNAAENGNNDEGIIDPRLEGQIAPQCWRLYMDIIGSCLSVDPHERPDMGDVEVQLERLLQLQEEADHANHGFYSFLI